MGIRQKEKAEMTKQELTKAMWDLFLAQGYEATSIKDISEAAGYSVGSFYRHWPSKQEAFMEIWDSHISAFIQQSVEEAPAWSTAEEMVDYLVRRSAVFSEDEITIKLYGTSRMLTSMYEYGQLTVWSSRYRKMLYNFIKKTTGCKDERKLNSTANIMHAVLDAHAMQHTRIAAPRYQIDDQTLRDFLIKILS